MRKYYHVLRKFKWIIFLQQHIIQRLEKSLFPRSDCTVFSLLTLEDIFASASSRVKMKLSQDNKTSLTMPQWCLKITINVTFGFFNFGIIPPIFITIKHSSLHSPCWMRLFLWFSNTVLWRLILSFCPSLLHLSHHFFNGLNFNAVDRIPQIIRQHLKSFLAGSSRYKSVGGGTFPFVV